MAQITLNSTGVASDGALALQSNGTTTAVTIDTSQKVGIGTASPATTLHLRSAVCNVRLEDADTSAYANVGVDNSGSMYLQADPANSQASSTMYFSVDGTERMRIDSSGNLLVGTTSTINSGKAVIDFQGGGRGLAIIAPSAGGGAQAVHFYAGGTQVGNIAVTTTTTSYGTSSDYRLKHDIAPMTGALAKVALLKPVTYKWNADDSAGEGFIAHELQEVCPSAVTGEKDAVDAEGNPQYQGIDTSFLVATLTAAIQEQQAIITSLTDRLTALEAK